MQCSAIYLSRQVMYLNYLFGVCGGLLDGFSVSWICLYFQVSNTKSIDNNKIIQPAYDKTFKPVKWKFHCGVYALVLCHYSQSYRKEGHQSLMKKYKLLYCNIHASWLSIFIPRTSDIQFTIVDSIFYIFISTCEWEQVVGKKVQNLLSSS